MRNSLRRVMACIVGCMVVSSLGNGLWAVPAYTGWQVRTLADGSQVTVRQMGDEFYHYWETKDGKLAKMFDHASQKAPKLYFAHA